MKHESFQFTNRQVLFSVIILVGCYGAGCGPVGVDLQDGCASACDPQEVCDLGACRAACKVDQDCSSEHFCVGGACRPLTPCETTGQCQKDEVCKSGLCVPVNRQCVSDIMCEGGTCSNGICVAENPDDEDTTCSNDAQCPGSQVCDFGFCKEPEGSGSSNAGDGTSDGTSNGSSEGSGSGEDNGPCEGDGSLPYGSSCQTSSECCSGFCVGRPSETTGMCTERCTVHDDCNPSGGMNYNCATIGNGEQMCVQNDYGTLCSEAAHCNSLVCLSAIGVLGQCSYTCNELNDCPAGTACGTITAMDQYGQDVNMRVCTPIGETCFQSDMGINDCLSQLCYAGETGVGGGYCTTFCFENETPACPSGFECRPAVEGGYTFCLAPLE